MSRIFFNGNGVYLDFCLSSGDMLGLISFYDRSLQVVKSFGASLSAHPFERILSLDGKRFDMRESSFDTYIQPVSYGKEKFYHAIAINRKIGTEGFLCIKENRERQLYDFLMKNYDLPLMAEWSPALYSYMEDNRQISKYSELSMGEDSVTEYLPINGKNVSLSELELHRVYLTSDVLAEDVQECFHRGLICITEERQRKLNFSNMDEYFKEYGHTLVENLSQQIVPLRDLDGEAHDFTLKTKRLYPQQLAQVNGDVALLEKGKFAILNHGMGTGKVRRSA